MAKEALNVLDHRNRPPRLFRRGGQVIRIEHDDDGRGVIRTLEKEHLRGELAEAADFVRKDKSGAYVDASPPDNVTQTILTSEDLPFPILRGIVDIPVLRPDGSVFDSPGYDDKTGLYYALADARHSKIAVPDKPTETEVAEALQLVEEIVCDFPFIDGASRANAIAAMLTPIVRPAITGPTPLALIDAPQMGTGKTLLASVIAVITTGSDARITTMPSSDEEFRKRVTSILLAGEPVVLLDNVEAKLRSSTLAAVLTSKSWTDRRLGKNETVTVPSRAVWIATGNNISLGGDLVRRCYVIRLDATSSEPFRRQGFKHPDLLDWVGEKRDDIVAALLTLARAWYEGGCPDADSPILGSFEDWSQILGGILANVGIEAFLGNLEDVQAADADEQAWERFLSILLARFGDQQFTALQVDNAFFGPEPLEEQDIPEALPSPGGRDFCRKLGLAFFKRDGHRHGTRQLRIERCGIDSHDKVRKWTVRGGAGTSTSFVGFEMDSPAVVPESGGYSESTRGSPQNPQGDSDVTESEGGTEDDLAA